MANIQDVSEVYVPETKILNVGSDIAFPVSPANFPTTQLRYRNERWATKIGLAGLSEKDWLAAFGRFEPLPGNLQKPLALAYHGHQFGVYNPEIGDGRGFLYAQLRDDAGRLLDLGTKGSGRTPFSRSGDGRLTLKGGVREALATAMLEALGVYTSKTLSLIETGEALERNDEPSPTRSAVLVRLQHSHIRFGTFQRLAYLDDREGIDALVRYCIECYFPTAAREDLDDAAAALLTEIVAATASLAASWMIAGFVHGVLNTDNMVVTGESFDYGPYRFLPTSDPNFVAAYFDGEGLYRFGRQPTRALWNLQQLAGCLTLVCAPEKLEPVLQTYTAAYAAAFRSRIFERLGVARTNVDDDTSFMQDLFSWMTKSQIGWSQLFFDWFCGPASAARAMSSPAAALYEDSSFSSLKAGLMRRTPIRPERLDDEHFQHERPQTLEIDEIEAIWAAIDTNDDWSAFESKLDAIDAARTAF
ncbi:MAG: YdiU family protein, partial [Pseudomonadota bacterium]